MLLDEESDITAQPSSTIPKKIDRWFYEKTQELLREQIRNLKDENLYLRSEISLSRTVESKSTTEPYRPTREPIKANKIMSKFEMEEHEKRKFWEAEIKRREVEAKTENILEVDA